MPATFPAAFDVPANPNLNTSMAASGFEHDLQHVNINDMMKAVQLRVGINNSPDNTSVTNQLNTAIANITVLQGSVSTLSSQLGITNSNLTAVTNNVASNTASIATLTATKLNLAGGTMTGQLVVQYRPPAVSANSYTTSQLFLSNTGSTDNPPQLGFQATGALGLSLYLTASGLNAITNTGGSSLIINANGQLNPLSFSDGSIPSAKIAPASIGTDRMVSASITNALLAPGSVDATKFAAGTMTAIQNVVGVPVGAVILYGGNGTSPLPDASWGFCDGHAVSRTTYSVLYGVLGNIYGSGDGSTTFNLPDFRARVAVGVGTWNGSVWVGAPGSVNGISPGWTGGEWSHVLTTAELANHTHTVSDPGHVHGVSDPGHTHGIYYTHSAGGSLTDGLADTSSYLGVDYASATTSGTGISIAAHATGISIVGIGGNNAHTNIQPGLAAMFIIKLVPGG